ncbi:hypothetical protein K504DRAFT_278143 [Pleomassaria siparia CBS 279.74]|uniref:Uncharacterized protein n=1 Tax=Pleomassaria siparia CBS 279.74 TaxID=1314801 RepID=A0A6G1KAE5_9PLEO|nr:hypothetical protein K504DRAFT_278143 [Pleomassaria siparia CBS 279.74]
MAAPPHQSDFTSRPPPYPNRTLPGHTFSSVPLVTDHDGECDHGVCRMPAVLSCFNTASTSGREISSYVARPVLSQVIVRFLPSAGDYFKALVLSKYLCTINARPRTDSFAVNPLPLGQATTVSSRLAVINLAALHTLTHLW